MELPVIGHPHRSDSAAFVRAIKRANAELAATFTEQIDLPGATVRVCRDRPQVWDANAAYDVRVPENSTAGEVYDEVQSVFERLGRRCATWISSETDFDDNMAATLRANGYEAHAVQVMVMEKARPIERPRTDVQIIPARAALAQYREFCYAVAAHAYGHSVAGDIAACQTDLLDDPRLDMLLLRVNGAPIAGGGVFAGGETGIIWDIATHPEHRRRGYMRTLFYHILDLCSRSQFKSLILECAAHNAPAIALYESIGMRRDIVFHAFRPPDACVSVEDTRRVQTAAAPRITEP